MVARSDRQPNSRYVRGGTSTSTYTTVGWWERKVFPAASSDVPFVITSKYHTRPSKLAYDVYGDDGLMWFVLQYNAIVDVHEEFVEGREIKLPTRARLFGELLSLA